MVKNLDVPPLKERLSKATGNMPFGVSTVKREGRVTIPAAVRELFQIGEGSKLLLEIMTVMDERDHPMIVLTPIDAGGDTDTEN